MREVKDHFIKDKALANKKAVCIQVFSACRLLEKFW